MVTNEVEVMEIIKMLVADIEDYGNPPSYETKEYYQRLQAKRDYVEDLLYRIRSKYGIAAENILKGAE